MLYSQAKEHLEYIDRFYALNGLSSQKLYVLRCGENYKIGISKAPIGRRTNIQSSNAHSVEIILLVPFRDSKLIERMFHNHFAEKRLNGEWFRLDETDLQWIKNRIESLKGCLQQAWITSDYFPNDETMRRNNT